MAERQGAGAAQGCGADAGVRCGCGCGYGRGAGAGVRCRCGCGVQVWGCGADTGAVRIRVRCGCGGAGRCGGAVQVRGCGGRGSAGQALPAWRGRAGDAAPKRPPHPDGSARQGAALPRPPAVRRDAGKREGADAPSRTKKGTAHAKRQSLPPVDGACPCPGVICQGSPCRWSARRNTRPPRPTRPPRRRGAARRRSWGGRRGPPRQRSGWCGWGL